MRFEVIALTFGLAAVEALLECRVGNRLDPVEDRLTELTNRTQFLLAVGDRPEYDGTTARAVSPRCSSGNGDSGGTVAKKA